MNIIIDQDFGMRAGIEEVFPNTIHMHCRWHGIKKEEEMLGPFFAKRPELQKAYELCVDHSLTPEEFEQSWKAMIDKYQVQNNETLHNLWEKRKFWVPAYSCSASTPFCKQPSIAKVSTQC